MIAIPNMDKPKGCWDCFNYDCDHWAEHGYDNTADCPLIEIVQCKDCKRFELNVWGKFNGIPVIVAHEMCDFWGDGCKTNPNGFCSYGERRADEHNT